MGVYKLESGLYKKRTWHLYVFFNRWDLGSDDLIGVVDWYGRKGQIPSRILSAG